MIALREIEPSFIEWNKKWGAPFGYENLHWPISLAIRNDVVQSIPLFNRLDVSFRNRGMFFFQENNTTRVYEYPWAFYATPLSKNMNILEIGGGVSGFQFVLASLGMKVVNIDPGEGANYWNEKKGLFTKLNNFYGNRVKLIPSAIEKAKLLENSFDRIFCISVLEHLSDKSIASILSKSFRLLKSGGFFILTIDLFLDTSPFCDKKKNIYGRNVSVADIVRLSKMQLVQGKRSELLGFPEFNPKRIMSNLYKYYIGEKYPVMSQLLILQKH